MGKDRIEYHEENYNKCIPCEYLGIKCDGPNLTAASVSRFCQWAKLRKEYLGWTREKLSEMSGVSKTTVDRIMTGTIPDLKGETKSRIACALIYQKCSNGEGWGQFPCHLDIISEDLSSGSESAAALTEHKEESKKKIDHLKEEIDFFMEQLKEKDKQLSDSIAFMKAKNRTILALSISLGIFVLFALIVLIIDYLNQNIGFFWIKAMSTMMRSVQV